MLGTGWERYLNTALQNKCVECLFISSYSVRISVLYVAPAFVNVWALNSPLMQMSSLSFFFNKIQMKVVPKQTVVGIIN